MGALLERLCLWVRRQRLRRYASVAPDACVRGAVWVPERGEILIGGRAVIGGACAPVELRAGPGAQIVVAEEAILENGCSIEATRFVRVGARARLGAFCKLLDNHQHDVRDRSRRPPSQAVIVEEDCVIGPKAILLPGAHVGRGSRIGAGTVVSRPVPAGCDFSGAPPVLRALR